MENKEYEKKKRHVGHVNTLVSMAKYIKRASKGLKDNNKVVVKFGFSWDEKDTVLLFNDEYYIIDNILSHQEIIELTEKALNETSCRGVVYPDGQTIKVMLFAKPTKSFNMLSRLISKYSGLNISWKTIKKQKIGGNPESTQFMCYDDELCCEAVKFIRNNRTSKDDMFSVIRNEINGDFVSSILSITIKSKKGTKVKGTRHFSLK